MKKQCKILVVSIVIAGIMLSIVGTVLVPQTASAEKGQQPISAANMRVVKKVFISPALGEAKGKPASPPGQDKDKNGDEGAATGVLGDSLPAGASKYAVVIGICNYPETANDICASDGDSLNMYKALTELYGYTDENIYLYRDTDPITEGMPTDGPATFENIEGAVSDIRDKEKPGDEVVFFFSGHGGWTLDDNGDEADGVDEMIVVHDGSAVEGISDDMLVSWFSGFQASRIIFIFDTCLAGGMNDLADEEPSENGRVVVMSTEENKYAYVYSTGGSDIDGDGIEDGEGVFSHFFVNEGMLKGLADKYEHGIDDGDNATLGEDVVVEEAFDYAKQNIPPWLKRRQKPVISDGFNDDLLL